MHVQDSRTNNVYRLLQETSAKLHLAIMKLFASLRTTRRGRGSFLCMHHVGVGTPRSLVHFAARVNGPRIFTKLDSDYSGAVVPTTTAPKPRCSPHTGLLLASSFLSGLRSEHSSSPRSTLAGSSVNHAERHTRNTARSLTDPKILLGGEARGCAALGYAAGTGRGVMRVPLRTCYPTSIACTFKSIARFGAYPGARREQETFLTERLPVKTAGFRCCCT